MSKELEVSSVPRLLVPLLLLIAAAGVVDLWFDSPEIWWSPHVMTDVFLVVLSFATALYLWMGWRHTDRALARMMEALDEQQEERDLWRKRTEDLLSGLGEATEELFMGWTLTPTERETALLLLKGHSHKRIAQMTDRSYIAPAARRPPAARLLSAPVAQPG